MPTPPGQPPRWWRRLLRAGLRLLGVAVILLALGSLTLRLALPRVDGLREEIANRLEELLGVEVRMGALSGRLSGLTPVLALEEARLLDPSTGEPLLALAELRLTLDLLASLRAWQPRIDGITLVGAEIALHRGADGRLGVRGLDALAGGGGDAAALRFFLREGRGSLADSTLSVTDATGRLPALGLVIHRLDFRNRGERHRLSLHGRLAGDPDGAVTLLARLRGPARAVAQWSGTLHLDWHGEASRLTHGLLPAGLTLAAPDTRLRGWLTLAAGQVKDALLDLDTGALTLVRRGAKGTHAAELTFTEVAGLARLRPTAAAWRLELADLLLGLPGQPARPADAVITLGRPAGAPVFEPAGTLTVQVADLPLAPVAALAQVLAPLLEPALAADALPAVAGDWLAAPVAGRLAALTLHRPATGGAAPTPWRLTLDARGLGLPARGRVPAFSGLDLTLDTGPTAGRGTLTLAPQTLDLTGILAGPLAFERLAGDFTWQRDAGGRLRLEFPALTADTAGLASTTRLALMLGGADGPALDLHARLGEAQLTDVRHYLPEPVMAPQLIDWLHRALAGGRLTSGDLLLRGPLRRFPFDDGSGRFLLELRGEDATLDFAPARDPAVLMQRLRDPALARVRALPWPPLQELDVLVRIDGRRLEVRSGRARILNTRVDSATATLPDLWRPRLLEIEAGGHGPLTDGRHLLTTTPLSQHLAGVANALAVTGEAGVALQLGIAVHRDARDQVAGSLTLGRGVSVQPTATALRFTGVTGALRFDDQGVSAERLDAALDGQPVRLRIAAPPAATDLTFSGTTEVTDLQRRWPSPLWSLAGGRLDWQLLLTVPHRRGGTGAGPGGTGPGGDRGPVLDFRLTSDLRGLTLNSPAPFGKGAAEARPLAADLRWDGRWPVRGQLRVGDVGGRFEVDQAPRGPRLTRLALNPTALPEALPGAPGILIEGQVERVALAPWIAWFAQDWPAGLAAGPSGDGAVVGAEGGALPLLPLRLAADEVGYGPLVLRQVDARISPAADGVFLIDFTTADGPGQVRLPGRAGGPVTIALRALDVGPLLAPPAGAGTDAEVGAGAGGNFDPRGSAPVALDLDEARVGARVIGRLRAVTAARPDGLALREFSLRGPLIDATGTGTWTRDSSGYRSTRLELTARSSDLGEFLRQGGHYSELAGAPGTLTLALAWPGGPADFALARARGSLGLDIGAGRLLDLDPGVGRMLGVLNLAALRRRLSLDFTDLFATGFSFDSLRGDIAVSGGRARVDRLDLLASAADIRISGVTDLVNGTLDQTVRVTPKLGTGVAIAGAVAGGPLVGAAVYLVDKAAGGAVDRLARYDYRVTGPWREPTVTRVGGLLPGGVEAAPAEDSAGAAPPAPGNPFLEGQ